MKRLILLLVIIMVTVTGSCSTPGHKNPPIFTPAENIRPGDMLEQQKKASEPGPPPFTEELKPVTKGLETEQKLFSMTFDNAPIGSIINALMKDSDMNLSVESAVDLTKPVTITLKNATLEEVLEMAVVRGAGYAWSIKDNCLNIQRFQELTYHFDYLDIANETDIEIGGDMLASSVEGSGVSGKIQLKAKRSAENTDVWGSIQTALEGLKSEDGTLRVNRNSGVIYIADTPKKISVMVNFLNSLSDSLHRQVFIEAKIVEVNLNTDNKYGIDWSKFDVFFKSSDYTDEFGITFNSGGTILKADNSRIVGVLDFLTTQGDVSVLSNPHLAVMNGQSAIMTVGYQFPYGDIEGVERNAETGDVTVDASIKRAILGLQLGITARISDSGMITLHIVPTITRIQSKEDVELPADKGVVTISNPIIDLQELATTVRVKEGKAIVIAGLISQINQLDENGLPGLRRIPFLGSLFKHMQEKKENRELVIFITPHIMK
jgi:MSHA type pilus biogenesis protein MshL